MITLDREKPIYFMSFTFEHPAFDFLRNTEILCNNFGFIYNRKYKKNEHIFVGQNHFIYSINPFALFVTLHIFIIYFSDHFVDAPLWLYWGGHKMARGMHMWVGWGGGDGVGLILSST